MGTTEQQYCLKWNNHNSTLLSVFDHLLEEESLVDCTLYAEGHCLKAHKIILSACSPYLRGMFNSTDPNNPTNQIIHLVGIDFENLKSLVEYMYKGEANVPLHMLSSFIRAGESLKIKGLEVSATKQLDSDGAPPNIPSTTPVPSSLASLTPTSLPPLSSSTPLCNIFNGSKESTPSKKRNRDAAHAAQAAAAAQASAATSALLNGTLGCDALGGPGGILAARLASQPLLNITPEMLLARTSLVNATSQHPLQIPHPPPPIKKSRKSNDPKTTFANQPTFPITFPPGLGMPPQPLPLTNFLPNLTTAAGNKSSRKRDKGASSAHPSAPVNNNNYESEGDEGVLKIDEEVDAGKENRVGSISAASPTNNKHAIVDDDIVDLEESTGISTEDDEEEEPSMPGPGGTSDITHTQTGILNPWTGEPIHLLEDQDENSAPDGFPQILDSSIRSLNTSGGSCGENMPGGTTNGNTANGSSTGVNAAGEKEGQAKYACTRCGRSYLHQATLVRHQRYECGISASYPCPLCGRKFKRRDVLKGHMEKCANKSSQVQQAQQQAAAQAAVQAVINSGGSTSPGLQILSGAASPLPGLSPLPIVPPPIISSAISTISPFTPPPS